MTVFSNTDPLVSKEVTDQFLHNLQQLHLQYSPINSYSLALSGGLDSMVLLDLFAKAIERKLIAPLTVKAIYIDHQLQENSADWGRFCEKKCDLYNIAFQSVKVTIEHQTRQGVEQLARQARYAALFDSLENKESVLLTAHHANDQAETLLLNLFRGSGVSGLAAMQSVSVRDSGILCRPLLNLARTHLESYAKFHQLEWIEDPSNTDCSFRRNWLRQKILPMIETTYPNVIGTLSQTAERLQESELLLEKLAQIQFKEHCQSFKNTFQYWSLQLPETLSSDSRLNDTNGLSWSELKNMLRYWVKNQQFPRLNESILNWLLDTAYQYSDAAGQMQRKPVLSGEYKLSSGASWQLYHQSLFYLPAGKNITMPYSLWLEQTHKTAYLPNTVSASMQHSAKKPLEVFLVESDAYKLKNLWLISLSELDESLKSSINKKALKRFFQQNKIPVWQRGHWPFLVLIKDSSVVIAGWIGVANLVVKADKEINRSHRLTLNDFLENYWQTKFCWPDQHKNINY